VERTARRGARASSAPSVARGARSCSRSIMPPGADVENPTYTHQRDADAFAAEPPAADVDGDSLYDHFTQYSPSPALSHMLRIHS
jgi:hypothetical protein